MVDFLVKYMYSEHLLCGLIKDYTTVGGPCEAFSSFLNFFMLLFVDMRVDLNTSLILSNCFLFTQNSLDTSLNVLCHVIPLSSPKKF